MAVDAYHKYSMYLFCNNFPYSRVSANALAYSAVLNKKIAQRHLGGHMHAAVAAAASVARPREVHPRICAEPKSLK